MTKWQLFSLLAHHGTATFLYGGYTYILQSIERESGDGCSFNVTCTAVLTGEKKILFIRTKD